MKLTNSFASLFEDATELWSHRYRLPRSLFLMLCLNLAIAPVVQAATGNELARPQAYALGLLGLATVALSIYLFVVMFQPERF